MGVGSDLSIVLSCLFVVAIVWNAVLLILCFGTDFICFEILVSDRGTWLGNILYKSHIGVDFSQQGRIFGLALPLFLQRNTQLCQA